MNINEIKELLKAFDESKANILKLKTNEFEIYLDKSLPNQVENIPITNTIETPIIQKIESKSEHKKDYELITSPMVGTFYEAPSPGAEPYVKIGDKVKKGQTLCIIEAMKIMNELEAEFDCEILEVLVEDGEPVEFDTPLFKVKRL